MVLAAGEVAGQRPGDRNFPLGSLGERDADRVSDAVAEQRSDADGRLDASLAVVARLGDAPDAADRRIPSRRIAATSIR